MSGEYYEIGTQIASDHTSAPRLVCRTATRHSHKTSPFEGPERQQAVEMIERMAAGDEVALAAFYQRFGGQMTGRAGQFRQNFCGSRTSLRARRCYLTRRTACSRKRILTIEYGKTKRDLGIAMNHPLESFAQPDGPVDRELMERISEGDTLAFAEFYDRYSPLLFSIAVKVVGDLQEAEEVLQDSARLVWERAPLYDPALGRPLGWAIVITRNKAIDRLRILQRKSEAVAKIAEQAAADFLTHGSKPPNETVRSENCTLLRDALTLLPAKQRVAIELAFYRPLSNGNRGPTWPTAGHDQGSHS
jgi:RNA polymerase sigma-70 factor (ECF subfamily)